MDMRGAKSLIPTLWDWGSKTREGQEVVVPDVNGRAQLWKEGNGRNCTTTSVVYPRHRYDKYAYGLLRIANAAELFTAP